MMLGFVMNEPDDSKPKLTWIKYTDVEPLIMTFNCPTCNTELPIGHPAATLEKLLVWVEANGGWATAFEDHSVGDKMFNDKLEIVGLKTTYDTGDVTVENYYGESSLPQGATFETYIVVKIGDLFYKLTGTGDSYGDVVWNSQIKQVQATKKIVWEFK